MKSDRSRQCAWTMAVLQASLACAPRAAGGNNEVLAPDDAATPSVADSGAGTPPDAGQAVPDAGSASEGGDDSGPAGSPVTGDDSSGADGGGVTSTGGGDSGSGIRVHEPHVRRVDDGLHRGQLLPLRPPVELPTDLRRHLRSGDALRLLLQQLVRHLEPAGRKYRGPDVPERAGELRQQPSGELVPHHHEHVRGDEPSCRGLRSRL